MHTRMMLALILFLWIIGPACKSHTTEMQQSMAGADEAAVISLLRSIAVAQRAYSLSNDGNYGAFEQLTQGGYFDERFDFGRRVRGYTIAMNVAPKAGGAPEGSYTVNADPEGAGEHAFRHFYMDSSSAVIHVNASQPATKSDESISP